MGFWDAIYSIGDKLKGISPDLSTAIRAAYNRTSAAVDQAVKVDRIQKLHQYLPADETRAQIAVFTTTLAKNAGKYVVHEGYKHIPGATVVVKLISDTTSEIKRENHKDELKTMQAKMDRSEEDLKKSKSQPEISSQNRDMSSHDGDGNSDRFKKNSKDRLKIISKI